MKCLYLKQRQKNYKPYLYCSFYKKEITFDECKSCPNKTYKDKKLLNRSSFNKRTYIRKCSKKRETVKPDTYNAVLERDKGQCQLCRTNQRLQAHHIVYRSEDKSKINDINNLIMLCLECHNLVHTNKKKYQPTLQSIVKEKAKHSL